MENMDKGKKAYEERFNRQRARWLEKARKKKRTA